MFFLLSYSPCCFPWCCVWIFTDMSQHCMSQTCQSAPSKTTSSLYCSVALFPPIASVSARNARTCLRLIRCGRGRRQIRRLDGVMRLLWKSSYDKPTLSKKTIVRRMEREHGIFVEEHHRIQSRHVEKTSLSLPGILYACKTHH